MNQHLNSFKSYLHSKGYHPNTVRNYLADTNKYFDFVNSNFSLEDHEIETYLKDSFVTAYFQFLSGKNNSRRYLASLASFCQFSLDQKLISKNPFRSTRHQLDQTPQITISELINLFKTYLSKKGKSQSTIKNYINDIQQFLSFSLKES